MTYLSLASEIVLDDLILHHASASQLLYLFVLQLSSLCHLGELSFIWTYLCGNKVKHNHLLLTFFIFCMWALISICQMVPFCQRLHRNTYFISLSSYLGSQYSLSLWPFQRWLCRICAVCLLAIPFFCSFCTVKSCFIFLHSFLPLVLFSKSVQFLISSLKPN